jgi:thiol-disulfide isomerase/thioredoxin
MRYLCSASLVLLALAATLAPASAQGVGLDVGTPLPDFTLTDLEGGEVQIREVVEPGKPAIIEIWAEWCTICRALEPQMRAIDEAHGDDVSIVAIAVAINQTREMVQAHKERFRLPWPFLWDGEGKGVRALDAGATGIILLVDREGKIAYTGTGARQDLVGEIEKLLGER